MRYAFVMQLKAGCEKAYLERHQQIWPELATLLTQYGIANYQIFLHPQTLQLFASFDAPSSFNSAGLKTEPLMHKWWDSMAQYMITQKEEEEDSNEPQSIELTEMFYMS
ncbi:MAG: L-rhamnose mutarotase [Oceanospirillaceae bacterium]|nr:L-rhamnose mutarotase [Oceanospirillaceae bacterium]